MSDADDAEQMINEGSSDENNDRELAKLRLQLEIEKLKLAQIQAGAGNGFRQNGESRNRVSEYAKDLRGVLAAMPESEALVPAWFVSVETVFKNFNVPEDVQGTVLLAYLSEKMRAVIARHGNGKFLSYPDVKQKVLVELRLTPAEYRRHFYQAKKGDSESWGQFLTRLTALLDHYTDSRKVKSLDDLRDLILADRLLYLMPEETRSYVALAEMREWHRPDKVVELAENFEEIKRVSRQRKPVAATTATPQKRHSEQRENKPISAKNGEAARPSTATRGVSKRVIRCYHCKDLGHYARDCPRSVLRESERDFAESRTRDETERKLLPKLHCYGGGGDATGPVNESKMQEDAAQYVRLRVGDNLLTARLDSGADITVLRRDAVSLADNEKESGQIRLKGAFGHIVPAQLVEVPLGIETENACMQQVLTQCAVTDELADGINALLTPHDWVNIKNANEKLNEEELDTIEPRSISIPVEFEEETCDRERDEKEEHSITAAINVAVESADPEMRNVESHNFATEQRTDESLKESWEHAKEGSHGMVIVDGLLYHNDCMDFGNCRQLVIPASRRREVLTIAHDSPWGGHFSYKKTKQRVKSAFYWPSVTSDIKKYCQSCHGCQIFSKARSTDRVPITPITRPEEPFKVIYLDCIGPLDPPSARGHRYALCLIDLCTRWPEVIPLRSLTARATCQALVDVFARYGTPELVCCDQGTNFTSKLTQELTERMGIKVRFSTPDHPQSNGIVERWNGTFKAMLRHVVADEGREWDRYVSCLLWAYREVPNEVTGVSPFQLMFGRVPHGPLHILQQTWTGN
ncbi:uncharacterized protein LOC135389211 [Ornithodoros turicata]|uniref:uncharacterized protein LOC135389211 n=1 Tax=Ornithodoros turicata TaxID=34597 RepID=UPI003139DF03